MGGSVDFVVVGLGGAGLVGVGAARVRPRWVGLALDRKTLFRLPSFYQRLASNLRRLSGISLLLLEITFSLLLNWFDTAVPTVDGDRAGTVRQYVDTRADWVDGGINAEEGGKSFQWK